MNRDMLDITKKARAYDNALKRAKEWMAGKYGHYDSDTPQEIAEFIFPELKENEDEKMWKAIYNAIKYLETELSWDFLDDVDILDVYAWLEKQSNKSQGKSVLEAIKEEKIDNTDNVEPKFHEGDIIKHNKANIICKVVSNNSGCYHIENIETSGGIELWNAEQNFHLWTIEDAKDGDVLCIYECDEPKIVFIFKGIFKKHCALSYHCYYNIMYPYFSGSEKGCLVSSNKEDVKTATKEQHELLLQKMKEAGYEWDVDKKELKKIEQTIEIPFGVKDSELQEFTYYIPEGYHAEINDNVVVIKKGK